jgi:hypothetical protein
MIVLRAAGGAASTAPRGLIALLAAAACSMSAVPAAAQSGDGTTTAAVLQLPGGSRAAGFGGAYTAATDGDVVFYNPAGAAWLAGHASVSWQRQTEQIGFMTGAAAATLGPVALAVTVAMLDFGSITELVPDPAFGGQRGIETGNTVSASDVVARVGIAAPLLGRRLAIGASAGLFWSTLAESARTATVLDAGMQYRASSRVMLGAALRNAGGPLDGANLGPADLPTEIRAGIVYELPPAPARALMAAAHFDVIEPLNGGATAFALGVEGGTTRAATVPGGASLAAVLRAGFNGTPGPQGVGRLHAGAGLVLGALAVDYTLQSMGVLGMTHRVGVRWNLAR